MDTHPPSSQQPAMPSQGVELGAGQPLHRVGSNSIDGTCMMPLQVQTSPRSGARSASPSVHTTTKPGEMIQTSTGEENPRSVPPSSVLSTASPRGSPSVSSSPQRPAVSSWSGAITSGSSTGTTPAVGIGGSPFVRTSSPFSSGLTRVPSGSSINANVQLMTQPSAATSGMMSFSESQPVSVPQSQSFSLSGQLGSLPSFSSATSGLVAQPTLAGSMTSHPPNSGTSLIGGTQPVQAMVPGINQGPTPGYPGRVAHRDPLAIVSNAGVDSAASALTSLSGHPPSAVQTTTTMSGQPGFQSIKVSATTTPYSLGANAPPSYTAKLPAGNPPSVPAQGMSKSGNYQAAVAAAEFALQQANITAQRGQMRPTAPMLPSGQVPGSVGMPGQPGVGGPMLTAQPTSNPIGLPGQQQQMKQPGQSTGMLPSDSNPLNRSLPSSSIPPAFSTSIVNLPSAQLPHSSTMNPIAAGHTHPKFSVSGAQPNISISPQLIPGQQQQTLTGQQAVVGLSRLIF